MNREKISFCIRELASAFDLSLIYVVDGKIHDSFQPFIYEEEENQVDFIVQRINKSIQSFSGSNVFYDINKFLVLIGIITKQTKESNEFILVGPIASTTASSQNILDYLFESGINLDAARNISNYMIKNKRMNFEQFLHVLSTINFILNDEEKDFKDFINISKNQGTYDEILENKKNSTDIKEEYDDIYNTVEIEKFQRKINFCVKNGLVDLLPEMIKELSAANLLSPSDGFFKDEVKNAKIAALGALFSAENLSLEAGVPSKTSENLKNYFLNKIDYGRSPQELGQISIEIICEFTKMIRDNREYVTTNPTVNRIINYIQANICTKLTANKIANDLKISVNYLFVSFKKEMNITLVDFITKEKVKKAEYLLIYTDKPLIDIAYYLSFSSQSYFQTSFKKIKGITPTDYRKMYRNS